MERAPSLRSGATRSRARLRLVPIPLVMVLLSTMAVSLCMGIFALRQMRSVNLAQAHEQARLLSATLSARISEMAPPERADALLFAAKHTGAEFVILSPDGEILADITLGGISAETYARAQRTSHGQADSRLGPLAFATSLLSSAPGVLKSPYLVAFVRVPATPDAGPSMLRALLALTVLLSVVGSATAYVVSSEAVRDVRFVTERISRMTLVRSEPSGEQVPIRSLDEVGELAARFNRMVSRFGESEKTYRTDLLRAKNADHDRASFLAAVSHELRTPLHAILGFSDVLLSGADGPLCAEAREDIEQVRASGSHLLDLVRDILEFSALETGELRLRLSDVDVTELFVGLEKEAQAVLVGRPIRFQVSSNQGIVLRADAKRLRQIVTNLVSNAIKFTREGFIRVSANETPTEVVIAVRDTGPGINDQERAVIFEEYKQSEAEGRRRRGSGLGLAIARNLVTMHRGRMELRSRPGWGSEFRVIFPKRNS